MRARSSASCQARQPTAGEAAAGRETRRAGRPAARSIRRSSQSQGPRFSGSSWAKISSASGRGGEGGGERVFGEGVEAFEAQDRDFFREAGGVADGFQQHGELAGGDDDAFGAGMGLAQHRGEASLEG
jgi:hypothetical protein